MPPVASRDRDVESRLAPEKIAFFGKPQADRSVVSELTGSRWYNPKALIRSMCSADAGGGGVGVAAVVEPGNGDDVAFFAGDLQ